MFRIEAPKHVDEGYFRRTAGTTRNINLNVRIYRGGIRL